MQQLSLNVAQSSPVRSEQERPSQPLRDLSLLHGQEVAPLGSAADSPTRGNQWEGRARSVSDVTQALGHWADEGNPAAANLLPRQRDVLQSTSRDSASVSIPVPAALQAKAEEAIGQSCADVRIHVGSSAAASAAALNADAFTFGRDIFVAAGKYAPGTPAGDHLLLHELAHTVQQGPVAPSSPSPDLTPSEPASAAEVEADEIAAAAMLNRPRQKPVSRVPIGLHRRKATEGEQHSLERLEAFSRQVEVDLKERKLPSHQLGDAQLPADARAAKANLASQIQGSVERDFFGLKIPSDPPALRAALWTLKQWSGQGSNSVGAYAEAQAAPHHEDVADVGADKYKCNRFVSDAYAVGAGYGYGTNGKNNTYPVGERGFFSKLLTFGEPGYPPSANQLGDQNKQIPHLPVTNKPVVGDVVAFPYNEGIGHAGIVLGNNLYISTRSADDRPAPSMQPKDGVQIKRQVDGGVFRHWST